MAEGVSRIMARVLVSGVAAVAMAAGLALPASAQIDPSVQPSLDEPVVWPTPTNAAPIYWRAFFTFQTNEDLKGTDWSAMLDDDDAGGYALTEEELSKLEQAQGVIAIAMRASKVEACTWEIDYDQGVAALLPHLGPMRNLARLLAADLRRCVVEGDVEGAVARLESIHGFARHCRGDGVLISSLVSCAISRLAMSHTSQMLARVELTPDQQSRLVAALDAYGDDPFGVRRAVGNEGVWLTAWLAQEVRAGRLGEQLDMLFLATDDSDTAHLEDIRRMSDRSLVEDLRRCRAYYEDALRVWDERDAVARLEVIQSMASEGRYGAFARVLASALTKSHEADDRGRQALGDSREEILADPTAPQH